MNKRSTKIQVKVLKSLGLILLITLNLIFLYWIETFHYLGCGFPFLFGFVLVPFLLGFFASPRTEGFLWRASLPLIAAALLYAGGVMALSGGLRCLGWLVDIGPLLLAWAGAYSVALLSSRWLKSRSRRSRNCGALIVSLALVLAAVFQFLSPPYSRYFYLKDGVESFFTRNIEDKSFEQAWGVIGDYLERKYPYFEYKGIDWKSIRDEAEEKIKTAKNENEFYAVVRKSLDSLDDGHVKLSPGSRAEARALMTVGAVGAIVEGKPIVLTVESGSPAEEAGLHLGIEIVLVNDEPLTRRKFALYGPRGGRLSVSYVDENQLEQHAVIQIPSEDWRKPSSPFTWKSLPGGYGYLRIRAMAMDIVSFVPTFDRFLQSLWRTNGLVIDIRFNTGGAIVLTDQILGRFTDRRVHYGGMMDQDGRYAPLYVVPRRLIYRQPVFILINEWNGSAADFFAYAAAQLDRVTLVGRTTSGVVSNPSRVFKLPGGARVQLVSSGLADRSRRFVVEDVGVQPDIAVPYSLLDIRAGLDRDLETAIEILRSGHPPVPQGQNDAFPPR